MSLGFIFSMFTTYGWQVVGGTSFSPAPGATPRSLFVESVRPDLDAAGSTYRFTQTEHISRSKPNLPRLSDRAVPCLGFSSLREWWWRSAAWSAMSE